MHLILICILLLCNTTHGAEPRQLCTSGNSCIPGTYKLVINPYCSIPYSYSVGFLCQECDIGTYLSTSTTQTACDSCPTGQYGSKIGATACSVCTQGTYSSTTGSTGVCQACLVGSYQSGSGASVCTSCSAGQYRNAIWYPVNLYGFTELCETSYYKYIGDDWTGYPMYGCVNGTGYIRASQANNVWYWQLGTSYSGFVRSFGEPTVQTLLSVSTYVDWCYSCSTGTYSSAIRASSASTCVSCSGGSYGSTTSLTKCTQCSQGMFSPEGSTACSMCPAGTYGHAPGISACINCTRGSYSSSTGKQACTACDFGLYTTATRATTCASCAAGTYAYLTGSTTCTPCPNGTGSFPAARACVTCV